MSVICRFLMLSVLSLFLATPGVSFAKGKSMNLKLRQPIRGASVQRVVKQKLLSSRLEMARKGAESLDAQSMQLLDLSTMSPLQRWMSNRSLSQMQKQYSTEMLSHLQAMTVVFKSRREAGGFTKLNEFDFQNIVRKSDYLLALQVTQGSLQEFAQEKNSGPWVQKILESYNYERKFFDHKTLKIADL